MTPGLALAAFTTASSAAVSSVAPSPLAPKLRTLYFVGGVGMGAKPSR